MAVNITSAYDGEVLEKLLTRATTGNELVERGLIKLVPNVGDKYYIPRMRAGSMLQKRKEQPKDSDSKGNFDIDERVLKPNDFMAFTTFNPRAFEHFWRPWQPKGELVFSELPVEVQNKMLEAMANSVDFELGYHFINGVFGEHDDRLFNGFVSRMLGDKDVINLRAERYSSMIEKLKVLVKKIPTNLRSNPNLRILMSTEDADTYDDELTAQTSKGANYTDMNAMRFKGIKIEPLAQFPTGLIVATNTGMDDDTNLWAGVNLVNDFNAVKIAPLTNAGERYFFKMLMKADTNIAWSEDVVLLDSREQDVLNMQKESPLGDEYNSIAELKPKTDGERIVVVEGNSFELKLGTRVELTNAHSTNKAIVSGFEVAPRTSVVLSYDGKNWFVVKD